MSNDNYPPGVTDGDIDKHFGPPKMKTCPDCSGQGSVYQTPTMPAEICLTCNGEGEIEKQDEFFYDDEYYE